MYNFQFEDLFGKLSENIEDILAFNHMGLIVRIAEACRRLGCKQAKLIRVRQSHWTHSTDSRSLS